MCSAAVGKVTSICLEFSIEGVASIVVCLTTGRDCSIIFGESVRRVFSIYS